MGFNESLDILTKLVLDSKDKPLRKAFKDFLFEYNESMQDYVKLMNTMEQLNKDLKGLTLPIPSKWDVELIGEK